jgi:hypothetical protein
MTENQPWESSSDIEASVRGVEGRLFARLRARRPRRRIALAIGALVAAVALFVGGIAFGAAAYAAPGRTVPGVATPGPGAANAAFSVSCYLTAGAAADDSWSTQQFTEPGDPASALRLDAARALPAATCLTSLDQERQLRSFDGAIRQQRALGMRCGLIVSPGVPDFYFHTGTSVSSSSSGSTAIFVLDGPTGQVVVMGNFLAAPEPLPSGCASVSLPATPALAVGALAACAVDASHASVYVRGSESAATVCSRHRYSTWEH